MIELGLVFSAVLSSELVLWLPLARTLRVMTSAMRRSNKVLLSRKISDNWKEKVLPVYALRIFRSSLMLPLLLAIVLAPIVIVTWLLSPSPSAAWDALTTVSALLLITGTSVIYLVVRVRVFSAKLFDN